MRSEDSDEGVSPVAFSDSDWERVNYVDELPTIVEPLKAAELIDDDGSGPCDMPEDDALLYGSDNDHLTNFKFRRSGGSISCLGSESNLHLQDSAYQCFEAMKARLLGNHYFCRYVKGNCMKQAALFTSLAIMFLPLFLMVLTTVMLLVFLVFFSAFVPVIVLCVGFLITVVWIVWISVPLFLIVAAVWIGAEIFEKLFDLPKASSSSTHSRNCSEEH